MNTPSILFSLLLLVWAPATKAADPKPVPGAYESLLLGFDEQSGLLTGYYESYTGENPAFSCIFYFHGRLTGRTASISSYFPPEKSGQVIPGQLKLEGQGSFSVLLSEEHGGCWNVQHFANKNEPAGFGLGKAQPWRWVGVVKAGRAYFHDAPEAKKKRRGYVVKGNAVGIRAAQNGWFQVDYPGARGLTSGWLQASDLYPIPKSP